MLNRFLSTGLIAMAFSSASCDNAASKIKSESEKSNETSSANIAAETAVDASVVNGNSGTPAFAFDSEFHNFGDIQEGEQVEHIFTFTNSGDAPLIISNAQGSCGCTVPNWPRNPIAPGETGEIKVTFNSAGRKGKQDKRVTLNANTTPNTYVLNITSNVIPKSTEEAS